LWERFGFYGRRCSGNFGQRFYGFVGILFDNKTLITFHGIIKQINAVVVGIIMR